MHALKIISNIHEICIKSINILFMIIFERIRNIEEVSNFRKHTNESEKCVRFLYEIGN